MSAGESGEDNLPVQSVLEMRQKDYDNNQIIQELQDQGYSSSQIFDALNKADMREINDRGGSEPKGEQRSSQQSPARNGRANRGGSRSTQGSNEELIEEIIEEKWHDLVDKLQVVIDWKERSERRIQDLESRVSELDQSLERLQKSMGDRLEDYDDTMQDVQSDVKAMEDTFSEALPAFTENVSKMQALLEEMESDRVSSAEGDHGDDGEANGGYETVSGGEP
jgi:DNA-binding transcriptional MerR regulator